MNKIDLIIDALEKAKDGWQCFDEYEKALAAARELKALAQPEQEPVCDKDPYYCGYVRCQLGKVCKNTAQPEREWVGLTDDEIEHLRNDQPWWMVRDIEAKLKEKNGGV